MNKTWNKDIVLIKESYTSYIDDAFFQTKQTLAQQSFRSYPVEIVCLPFGWILESKHKFGHKLLNEIYSIDNYEIYKNRTLKMIIEFMYNKQKSLILKCFSPVQLINMITLIILSELLINNEASVFLNIVDQFVESVDEQQSTLDIVTAIVRYTHLVTTILQALLTCLIINGMRTIYFQRVSSYVDLLATTINFIVQV